MTARPSVSAAPPNPHPRLLSVTVRPAPPGTVVFAVRGEVDVSTSPFLRHLLLPYLHDVGTRVTVDLTDVDFLSAAGLTVLVNARAAAAAAGSRLCLVARTRAVLLPLTITGLAGEFDIHPDHADAPPVPAGGPDG